jgi:formylglycine-generating enzyme required for sulfatase activity
MKKVLVILSFLAYAVSSLAAPTVSNVRATQRTDGTRLVDIRYNLSGGSGPMSISVTVSPDNGATWSVQPASAHLSGHVGQGITNGNDRHIVWNAGADRPDVYWPQCRVRVTARESDAPDEITIDLPGGVTLDMVRIPSGSFMMGRYPGEQGSYDREDPQHQVNIGYDFYMGKYEVTKAQWQAVMGTTPWSGQSYVLDDPNSPAVYVSWNDAQAFVTALNQLGQGTFRLPSEAEWEYACRAGTTTRFYWGDDPDYSQIGDYAWYDGNAWDVDEKYAHVVGRKLPNAYGLHDMSGNVWEWCEDDWHSNYNGAPSDGGAWVDSPRGSSRVLRGGSWDNGGNVCRSADRGRSLPGLTYGGYGGFRLSRTP